MVPLMQAGIIAGQEKAISLFFRDSPTLGFKLIPAMLFPYECISVIDSFPDIGPLYCTGSRSHAADAQFGRLKSHIFGYPSTACL